MKSLTPEQQAFAEEHHGLLLDFMAKHSLGDDYYDLLANRYLKVVVRYLSEEALRKYSFSTVGTICVQSYRTMHEIKSENCRRSQSSSIVRSLHLKLLRLMMASGAWSKITSPISSLRRSSSATRATPIVKLLNYAESVAKRLKSALPGSAKYYLIIRRTEL